MSNKHPLWKSVGKLAVEKAVETLVEEGVEASVEIWKKYRLKLQEDWFENRKDERESESRTPDEKSAGQSGSGSDDPTEQSGSAEARSQSNELSPDGHTDEGTRTGRQSGSKLESFENFVRRRDPRRSE
jgi:hypothetical protein